MRIAVKQRFLGGPLDGEQRVTVYREPNLAEAFDALLPCRFDANGVPLWAAWYHSEPGVDLIVGGSIALAFQDYMRPSRLQCEVYRKHLEAQKHGN